MVGTSYAYAVGRVRVLEKSLLTWEQLDRMIDAPSPEEVLRLLSETTYGQRVSELKNSYEFEKLLSASLLDTYHFLQENAPVPAVINLFLYRHDFHNLKALMKGKYSRQPVDNLLVEWGVLPLEVLSRSVENGDYRDLPPQAAQALEEIDDIFLQGEEPQAIDLILDQAYFRLVFDYLNKHNNPFLREYFGKKVDLINLRNFFRLHQQGNGTRLEQVFIRGGNIPIDVLFGEEPASLAEKTGLIDYRPLLEKAVEAKGKEATALERLMDDYLLDYVRSRKGNPFGPEPLVGYLLAREQEVLALRIIMVGKINRIEPEVLRKRVRNPYV